MPGKTVSVLHVLPNSSLNDEFDDSYREFLVKELTELEYTVKKYVILEEDENFALELDLSFRLSDCVIVVGNLQSRVILSGLGKLCGLSETYNAQLIKNSGCSEGSASEIVKLLTTSRKAITPIIHVRGIFILDADNVEESFLHILKDYLNRYNQKGVYRKQIEFRTNEKTDKVLQQLKLFQHVKTLIAQDEKCLQLTYTSHRWGEIVACEAFLKEELQTSILNSFALINHSNTIYKDSRNHIIQAIQDVEQCFETYGPENVFLSFNGGKDCTVLLHLIYTVLNVKYPYYKEPITCLYVTSSDPFKEQDEFIQQCEIYYNLKVIKICGMIKEALSNVLKVHSNFQACFMGTRRTDPYSKELNTFQMTDPHWPQIMRVSPILNWHYSDIWDYLLFYKVPYCKLYDEGYTSLGNALNTKRNPYLAQNSFESDQETFLPAYKLLNEEKERFGRNK